MKFDLSKKRFNKRNDIVSCNGNQVNDLENIRVTLLNHTPYESLKSYIPEMVTATWNEDIQVFRDTLTDEDRDKIMEIFFDGVLIPSAMKSIQITLLLEGITTHDVTHLVRHTGLNFAADCTGDKYVVNRNLIVPSFLDDAPEEYRERFINLITESHKLYDDIVNNLTDEVHIQDARLVLPRTLDTYYYVTGSLFDFLNVLRQRVDMQVQPKSDNVFALRIYEALREVYPIKFNPNATNQFYVRESKHEMSSKWYKPLPQNETPHTLTMDTVYGDMTKMFGYSKYEEIKQEIEKETNK